MRNTDHLALFYADTDEYAEGVLGFVRPGLDAGEPVAIAVPPSKAALLRERLGGAAEEIEMLDMFELGRNPARIIPKVHAMLASSSGRLLHYVGEPIWQGRTPEEIREATRHEALINLAWPGAPIRILCPYDTAGLDAAVLADAEQTHPWLIRDGHGFASPGYHGPSVPSGCEQPLPEPPPGSAAMFFDLSDLGEVRAFAKDRASDAGLAGDRIGDFVLAVNEIATNSIKHAGAGGVVRVWTSTDEIVCQVEDPGHIGDPLAGRHLLAAGAAGGIGLWMVNQLCDLVEVRTTAGDGTKIRLHSRLEG
jgi:anti-sigma regulatory factor (Ser/Thr protein kinase)